MPSYRLSLSVLLVALFLAATIGLFQGTLLRNAQRVGALKETFRTASDHQSAPDTDLVYSTLAPGNIDQSISALLSGEPVERQEIAFARAIPLLERLGHWNTILEILENANQPLPNTAVRSLLLARASSAADDELIRWRRLVSDRYPNDTVLAVSLSIANGDWLAVELILTDPDNIETRTALELHLLGRAKFYQEKYEEGAAIWDDLRKEFPANSEFDYWYARSIRYAGHAEASLLILETLVQQDGNHIPAAYYLELALAYRDNGMCQNAIDATERGLLVADVDTRSILEQVRAGFNHCEMVNK